ncbi:MAG: hypothetical protein LH461_08310 [Spirochaetaceae bacterium]|nr:hypothetical protein [Spirochaetaceae bacterium]
MKLYADRPGRLLTQLLGDILVVIAMYWAVRLGRGAHEKVGALAVPGREAEEAATSLDGQLRSAANDVGDAPLVGDTLSRPFRAMASTSRDLAGTAQSYQDTVADVALLTGVMVALVPIVFVLAVWLPRRLSWVLEASAAQRLMRAGPAATELLAVRALARQPLSRLARLGPEMVTGWKAGDAASTATLASLELDELGLRQR